MTVYHSLTPDGALFLLLIAFLGVCIVLAYTLGSMRGERRGLREGTERATTGNGVTGSRRCAAWRDTHYGEVKCTCGANKT